MKVTGACHCGTITIEGEADPEKVSICHCTDCFLRPLLGLLPQQQELHYPR
jgi:hypothetical protein